MPHEVEEEEFTTLSSDSRLREPKEKLSSLGFESNLDSDALRNKLPKDFARIHGNNKDDFAAKDYRGNIRLTFGQEQKFSIVGDTSSAAYAALGSFIYRGTDTVAEIVTIKAIGSTQTGGTNGQFRVRDITNNQNIAESSSFAGVQRQIVDLGTVSNLPTGEAMFEIQAHRVGGPANCVFMDSLITVT